MFCTLGAVVAALMVGSTAMAEGFDFDAGADLRIRQEFIDNCAGLPYGGLHTPASGHYRNHIRFRPRVWAEVKGDAGDAGKWRFLTRLSDEFRWNNKPHSTSTEWPGEVIIDTLLLEGKGMFDGFMDMQLGRRDLWGYCGLDHVFVDGTPGDGSRTQYTDMANVRFNFEDESTLDVFGLYNFDDADDFRLGSDHRRLSSLSARFPDGSGDQDDWGAGAIWGSKLADDLKYQVFVVEKIKYHQEDSHTDLVGARIMPRFSETLTGDFEAMSQLNNEWSGFCEIAWKSARSGIKPIFMASYRYLSVDWDPMWARDAIESELFLYGTHNGVAWWSNEHYLKLSAGLEFSPKHTLILSSGPIFAAEKDDCGGGDGWYKGLYTRLKYNYPILIADRAQGERFEVFGQVFADLLNPGDYYDTDQPAWYIRWQLEFRF